MKSLGGLLVIFGAGFFVLDLLNRQFAQLAWIDNWGPTVATGIKVGLIVVGAALWFVGMKRSAPSRLVIPSPRSSPPPG
jgi:hypothetical protein